MVRPCQSQNLPSLIAPPTARLPRLMLPQPSLDALPCSLNIPLALPLKRPYSPSRSGTAITDLKFRVYNIYIYIIYTPNLGSEIILFDREKEQGRFKGSSERARGRSEGAWGSIEGARGSIERALRRSKRAKVLASHEA